MKIVIIGAPGSGKTHIARIIAQNLEMTHIEVDQIFWSGRDIRSEVLRMMKDEKWILDGHISKLSDLVLPKADKMIVIENSGIVSLFRSLKRDWKNFSKAWYNIQNYEKLFNRRKDLVDSWLESRPEDVIFLDNFSDLSESEIMGVCASLK